MTTLLKSMSDLEALSIFMQRNADELNALESYENLSFGMYDCQNVSKVTIDETLTRLASKDPSELKKIVAYGGEARYEHQEYYPTLSKKILIWYKFSFEQQGRNVLVKNHSDGSSFVATSMTNAREYIRYNY